MLKIVCYAGSELYTDVSILCHSLCRVKTLYFNEGPKFKTSGTIFSLWSLMKGSSWQHQLSVYSIFILYYTILYYTILYYTIPYHTIPYRTYRTVPYRTVPYRTVPYRTTILYYTVTFTSIIVVVVVGAVVVAIAVVVVVIAVVVVAQFSIPTGYRIIKTDGQDLRQEIIYVITSVQLSHVV